MRSLPQILVLCMLLVEAAILCYTSGTVVLPALVVAGAAVGLLPSLRIRPSRMRELVASLLLAVPFAILQRLGVPDLRNIYGFVGYPLTYAFALWLMSVQALGIYIGREPPSAALAFFGAVVMICAGNVHATAERNLVCHALYLAFTLTATVYWSLCKPPESTRPESRPRGRPATMAVLLALALVASAVASTAMYRNRGPLNRLFSDLVFGNAGPGAMGFSDRATLGSVEHMRRGAWSNRVALRVVSQHEPGYLRGKAFDRYAFSVWRAPRERTPLPRLSSPPSELLRRPSRHNLFRVRDAEPRALQSMDVWPAPTVHERMFVPLQTAYAGVPVGTLTADVHGVLDSGQLAAGSNYEAHTSRAPCFQEMSPALRERLTEVPPELDARVVALAERIFTGCRTTEEKTRAVETYFRTHYKYRIGIQVPEFDLDPLTYFLTEDPPPAAHCEYFACATAVLLRIAGVPARYVTGFVPAEWNRYGRYWIARNRDAHAWVEAYDEARGWVTVESTPASGVPGEIEKPAGWQFFDWLRFLLQDLRMRIRMDGIHGFFAWIGERCRLPVALFNDLSTGALAAKLVAVALLLYILVRLRVRRRGPRVRVPPLVTALHGMLERMDRRLAKQGAVRRESETLHGFAARIAPAAPPAADWYRRYAEVRYSGRLTDEAVKRLREDL